MVMRVWGMVDDETPDAVTVTVVPGYGGGGFIFLIWISTEPSASIKEGGRERGRLGLDPCPCCSALSSPGSVVGGGIGGRRCSCCRESVG